MKVVRMSVSVKVPTSYVVWLSQECLPRLVVNLNFCLFGFVPKSLFSFGLSVCLSVFPISVASVSALISFTMYQSF